MTDIKTVVAHAAEALSHVDPFSSPSSQDVAPEVILATRVLPASIHDALGRPTPPPYERRILHLGTLVGLALGVFLMMYVYVSYTSYQTHVAADAEAAAAATAAQDAVRATPVVGDLFQVTDSALRQSYSGSTTYDTAIADSSTSFAVLGSGVDLDAFESFLLAGGGDATTASDVLVGTIFLQTSAGDDGEHHTCMLGYADYYSTSVQGCVDLALAEQKLVNSADSTVVTTSTNVTSNDGTSTGALTIDDTTAYWTVHVVLLTSVYTISDGSAAYYVTVSMTNEEPSA